MPRPKQDKDVVIKEIVTGLNSYIQNESPDSVLKYTIQLNQLKIVKKKITSLLAIVEKERDVMIINSELKNEMNGKNGLKIKRSGNDGK